MTIIQMSFIKMSINKMSIIKMSRIKMSSIKMSVGEVLHIKQLDLWIYDVRDLYLHISRMPFE